MRTRSAVRQDCTVSLVALASFALVLALVALSFAAFSAGNVALSDDCFAEDSLTASNLFPDDSIKLGVLLQSPNGIGQQLEAMVRLAAWQVNSDRSMLVTSDGIKRKMCLLSLETKPEPFSTLQASMLIVENNVSGVIGPMWSYLGEIVAPLANTAQIPFISPAAFTTAFHITQESDQGGENAMPFLRRICCDNTHTALAVLDILKTYNWKRVALLISDTDYGYSTSQQFKALARANDIVILTTVAIPPPVDNGGLTSNAITSSLLQDVADLRSRIIVTFIWDQRMVEVLSVAKSLGLVGRDYAWIFAELIMGKEQLHEYIAAEDIRSELFAGALFTHLTPPPHETRVEDTLRDDWMWKIPDWYPNATLKFPSSNGTFNTYSLLAYDTAMLLARALNRSVAEHPSTATWVHSATDIVDGQLSLLVFRNGSALMEQISNSSFPGLTGETRVDDQGAVVRNSRYDVLSAGSNGSIHTIGSWERRRFPQYLETSEAVWFGGSSDVPKDAGASINRTLDILVPRDDEPFVFYDSNKIGNDAFSGFAIDLLQHIANTLGFKYTLHMSNDTFNAMVELVGRPDTKYDMAVGDITMTGYREIVSDLTRAYHQSTYRLLAKKPDVRWDFSRPFQFLSPFSWDLWLLVLAFLIASAPIYYLFEYGHLTHISPGLRETLWVSFSTFFNSQTPTHITTHYGRVYIGVVLFVILILQSVFVANMTSFLLNKDTDSPYQTLDDAVGEPVGAREGTSYWNYLSSVRYQPNVVNVTYADATAALINGTIKVYVGSDVNLRYLALQDCSVVLNERGFHQERYGFALKRGSPLLPAVDVAILDAWDSGFIEDAYKRRFVWSDPCKAKETDPLELANLYGLFFMLVTVGAICSIIKKLTSLSKVSQLLARFKDQPRLRRMSNWIETPEFAQFEMKDLATQHSKSS